jgi:hypothetical protein
MPVLLYSGPSRKAKVQPRHEFFYFIDSGDLYAVRYDDWKISGKPDPTNAPLVTNLRMDPWERYQSQGSLYGRWLGGEHVDVPSRHCSHGAVPRDVQGLSAERSPVELWRRRCA